MPVIGRYPVLAKLGEGGMAEIYLAEVRGAKGFSKRVVIKVLKAEHLDDPAQQSMFADEARLGSRLEHAHIPRILELGEHEGLPFMVQEFVDGPNLDVMLRRANKQDDIDVRVMVRVVIDVARALHYAHHVAHDDERSLGVIHRDVSMTNVLVSHTGVSKLIDFGVARFEDRETKTEANVLKGKMRYLAPETLRVGTVSHQSDLFALGVVLYTVVVGLAPWRNQADLAKRMAGKFMPPRMVKPEVSEGLEAIIVRCMSPDPAGRYATGAELADALTAWCLANGGWVSDKEVGTKLAKWFPEGSSGWLPDFDLEAHSFVGTDSGRPRQRDGGQGRVWLFAGLGAMGFGLGAAGLAMGALWMGSRPETPPEVVVEVVDPSARQRGDFVAMLELAEQAATEDDLASAGRYLRSLEAMPVTDPALLDRRQMLADRLDLRRGLSAAEALLATDPDKALERGLSLAERHPDAPEVEAFLERARAAIAAQAPKVVRPRPAPRPETAEPSMLTVKGSPEGAEVLVDGRVVGQVPMQLVIDPGTHDVSLRQEGFVQRRAHVEAKGGEPVTVSLDLPALQAPE